MGPDTLALALREERQFVLTLGGYALEIPGAALVTHERVPVPRFNFVQDVRVGRNRQAAFFERALDHYFQRALRPTFHVRDPVPDHLAAGLQRFGFRARSEPQVVLIRRGPPVERPLASIPVRRARPDEVDTLVRFWTGEREGEEFRRALEVTWEHPNPGESIRPLLAEENGAPVAAALVYEHDGVVGIHAVSTQPARRGQGAATALVAHALASEVPAAARLVTMTVESRRTAERLATLGFEVVQRFVVYELPGQAQLSLPAPGPPQPPRWRPPRRGPG